MIALLHLHQPAWPDGVFEDATGVLQIGGHVRDCRLA
eukprot:CAMPEP_0180170420 /NCGR_PEP_ID=MMETSP0986-20121125/33818_1 /TAXON_ID=697907 /ORGANISM="non described non described, Strain CCMP2293" /LENGTH=36 /DNA_ID= /DNA_START= /DNA_END= /DNA_ORIENTATION=